MKNALFTDISKRFFQIFRACMKYGIAAKREGTSKLGQIDLSKTAHVDNH